MESQYKQLVWNWAAASIQIEHPEFDVSFLLPGSNASDLSNACLDDLWNGRCSLCHVLCYSKFINLNRQENVLIGIRGLCSFVSCLPEDIITCRQCMKDQSPAVHCSIYMSPKLNFVSYHYNIGEKNKKQAKIYSL